MRHSRFPTLFCVLVFLCSCDARQPIRIGLIAGLTGTSPGAAIAVRQGAEIAFLKANRKGGVNGRLVELIVRDDRDSPETALEQILDLKRMGVDIVIGPILSVALSKAYDFAQENAMLILSPTTSTDEYSGKDDNLIRLAPPNAVAGPSIAEYMFARGHRRVSIAVDETNPSYTGGQADAFAARFRQLGGAVIARETILAKRIGDYTSFAAKLLAPRPDGLFMPMSGLGAALLCQELAKLGSAVHGYGISWTTTGELIELGGASAERMRVPMLYDLGSEAPAYLDLKNDFATMFGEEPTHSSCLSFEAASVLLEALRSSDTVSASSVKNAILSRSSFDGLQETIVFDPFGDVYRESDFYGIKDGKYYRMDDR